MGGMLDRRVLDRVKAKVFHSAWHIVNVLCAKRHMTIWANSVLITFFKTSLLPYVEALF